MSATADIATARFTLVGSPNSGKTTLFNALTGLRAKTGNYPGVTVSKDEGTAHTPGGSATIEDLPGTYSLDPISPDERIVAETLDDDAAHRPDGIICTLDATTLDRSLGLAAQVLQVGLPTVVVVTFTDELRRRGGSIDVSALSRALGTPVVEVVHGRQGVAQLRELLDAPDAWSRPVIAPPSDPDDVTNWRASILAESAWQLPEPDARTAAVDRMLLHPVIGTGIFFAVMYLFFQVIFEFAGPFQDGIETFFGWLGGLASEQIPQPWLASFVSEALIGGVGGVLVFLPQIVLLFVMVSLLEAVGYMSRAAFLMDRVMASAGLEGRAFVALLSSLACAIPGIMATRSLPSAKDRIATMMAAPLMTCAARLPVYVLLIAMLVPGDARVGPFGLQGTLMFALYLGGAVAAMTTAWIFQRFTGRRDAVLPFYMEMPPYRLPSLSSVALAVWESCKSFLRKVSTIIVLTSVILFALLSLPLHSDADMTAAGVDVADEAAVSQYTVEHSAAATIGRAVEPVFAPQGFDWRVNVGILASLAAREVFVATMGQIGAADDPEDPIGTLAEMRVKGGDRDGELLFTPGVIAAVMVFFLFALQCMATVGVMRRETGTWRWPAVAFGYMFALAWVFSAVARIVVDAVV